MANWAIIDTTKIVNGGNPVINTIDWVEGTTYDVHAGHGYDDGLIMVESDIAGKGWTYANGIFSPPVTPPPTAQQLAAAAMSAGLIVTSTNAPELNGTYGLDSNSQQNVIGTVTAILLTGNFPNGQSTMPWIDQNQQPHMWPSTAEFKIFATAFSTFVSNVALYAASNGAAGSIPTNEVTIP